MAAYLVESPFIPFQMSANKRLICQLFVTGKDVWVTFTQSACGIAYTHNVMAKSGTIVRFNYFLSETLSFVISQLCQISAVKQEAINLKAWWETKLTQFPSKCLSTAFIYKSINRLRHYDACIVTSSQKLFFFKQPNNIFCQTTLLDNPVSQRGKYLDLNSTFLLWCGQTFQTRCRTTTYVLCYFFKETVSEIDRNYYFTITMRQQYLTPYTSQIIIRMWYQMVGITAILWANCHAANVYCFSGR